jgi:hypothetical protein
VQNPLQITSSLPHEFPQNYIRMENKIDLGGAEVLEHCTDGGPRGAAGRALEVSKELDDNGGIWVAELGTRVAVGNGELSPASRYGTNQAGQSQSSKDYDGLHVAVVVKYEAFAQRSDSTEQ